MKRRLSSAKKAYNLLAPQQTTAGPSPVSSPKGRGVIIEIPPHKYPRNSHSLHSCNSQSSIFKTMCFRPIQHSCHSSNSQSSIFKTMCFPHTHHQCHSSNSQSSIFKTIFFRPIQHSLHSCNSQSSIFKAMFFPHTQHSCHSCNSQSRTLKVVFFPPIHHQNNSCNSQFYDKLAVFSSLKISLHLPCKSPPTNHHHPHKKQVYNPHKIKRLRTP